MQKTLLKLLTYELVERVARFDLLLSELLRDCEPTSRALLTGIQKELGEVRSSILAEKKFLFRMFDEKTLKEKGTQVNLSRKVEDAIYGPYQRLCELSRYLPQCCSLPMLSETSMFLKDALPDAACASVGARSIVFGQEGAEPSSQPVVFETESGNVLIETISYLQRSNPLGWLGLVETYAGQLVAENAVLGRLKTGAKGLLAEDVYFVPLVKHGLALRMLGPAYYYYAVAEALLHRDLVFLEKFEPALFYGLNYFNFVDKSLVILHEATEKSRELYDVSADTTKERLFHEDQVASVLNAVEKVIPERLAFSEKHFQRAIDLQDRLSQGTLIGSANLYPASEVGERLETALADGEGMSVYEMLSMVGESPNTPREIVNAGWINKLERSPVWLYDALSEEGDGETHGFDRLADRLATNDHLLLKSIETSEIHRVLLTTV